MINKIEYNYLKTRLTVTKIYNQEVLFPAINPLGGELEEGELIPLS